MNEVREQYYLQVIASKEKQIAELIEKNVELAEKLKKPEAKETKSGESD